MAHPEVDEKQMIRWQPVPRQSGISLVLLGVCLTALIATLGTSGTLLWDRAQKSESQLQEAAYKAVVDERVRIKECIQQPTEDRIQTVKQRR